MRKSGKSITVNCNCEMRKNELCYISISSVILHLDFTIKYLFNEFLITKTLGRGNMDPSKLVERPKRAPMATTQPTKSQPT